MQRADLANPAFGKVQRTVDAVFKAAEKIQRGPATAVTYCCLSAGDRAVSGLVAEQAQVAPTTTPSRREPGGRDPACRGPYLRSARDGRSGSCRPCPQRERPGRPRRVGAGPPRGDRCRRGRQGARPRAWRVGSRQGGEDEAVVVIGTHVNVCRSRYAAMAAPASDRLRGARNNRPQRGHSSSRTQYVVKPQSGHHRRGISRRRLPQRPSTLPNIAGCRSLDTPRPSKTSSERGPHDSRRLTEIAIWLLIDLTRRSAQVGRSPGRRGGVRESTAHRRIQPACARV